MTTTQSATSFIGVNTKYISAFGKILVSFIRVDYGNVEASASGRKKGTNKLLHSESRQTVYSVSIYCIILGG